MKFSVVLLATAASALVAPRDLATIKGVIANTQTGIDDLEKVALAFNGDQKPLIDESNKLIGTVNAGTATVQKTSSISTSEAISLISPVQELKKHAQALSDGFLSRRGDVEKAKACETTHTQIGKLKDASKPLIDAIISKVPDGVRGIANDQASQFTAVLEEAEKNFDSSNCHNA